MEFPPSQYVTPCAYYVCNKIAISGTCVKRPLFVQFRKDCITGSHSNQDLLWSEERGIYGYFGLS